MFTAPPTCITRLFSNVTSSTVDHGAWPFWFLTVNRIAKPFCEAAQLLSSLLPSIRTRRAFLSSSRFLTDHLVPTEAASLSRQLAAFVSVLWLRTMSGGTSPAIDGSPPPHTTFSPAPSRQ